MKTVIFFFSVLFHQAVFAQAFKVIDPVVSNQTVLVSSSDLSCKRLTFGLTNIQLKLKDKLGSVEQAGLLSNNQLIPLTDCQSFIQTLNEAADTNGNIQLTLQLQERSVLKLSALALSNNPPACEGASQELITAKTNGITLSESVSRSAGSLDCPHGITSYSVTSIDHVIQVLHEDGIPTTPEL